MNKIDAFRFRYAQLQRSRPSVVGSGIWFLIMFFLARVLFVLGVLGLFVLILIAFDAFHPPGSYGKPDTSQLQLGALACLLVMLFAGYSARMSRRVVQRNQYILEMEQAIEETILIPDEKEPGQKP